MRKLFLGILIIFFPLLIHIPPSYAQIPQGDLNHDGIVDLQDVILGLKVITGQTSSLPVYSSDTDVNQNNRIDESEVIYILQTVKNGTLPQALNDTGITWSGDYPSGNNAACTSNIGSPQDCNQGRDASHNDDSDGHAGFSFTKIDAGGNSLPANAASWSCVRDNVTGLVWEVKTDDGGIHHKDNTYRWGGKTALGAGYGAYYNDWDTLVDGSNTANFCGHSDWRVPTVEELAGLADLGRNNPAIDTVYFPNTQSSYFWSASPFSGGSTYAWYVYFYYGYALNSNRDSVMFVRLVRSGQ